MHDAIHFATMGTELKCSNVGPGSYHLVDHWGSDDRNIVNFIASRRPHSMSSSLSSSSLVPAPSSLSQSQGDDQRPWRVPPVTLRKQHVNSSGGSSGNGTGSGGGGGGNNGLSSGNNNSSNGSVNSGVGGGVLRGFDNSEADLKEKNLEIQSVRNLPIYRWPNTCFVYLLSFLFQIFSFFGEIFCCFKTISTLNYWIAAFDFYFGINKTTVKRKSMFRNTFSLFATWHST